MLLLLLCWSCLLSSVSCIISSDSDATYVAATSLRAVAGKPNQKLELYLFSTDVATPMNLQLQERHYANLPSTVPRIPVAVVATSSDCSFAINIDGVMTWYLPKNSSGARDTITISVDASSGYLRVASSNPTIVQSWVPSTACSNYGQTGERTMYMAYKNGAISLYFSPTDTSYLDWDEAPTANVSLLCKVVVSTSGAITATDVGFYTISNEALAAQVPEMEYVTELDKNLGVVCELRESTVVVRAVLFPDGLTWVLPGLTSSCPSSIDYSYINSSSLLLITGISDTNIVATFSLNLASGTVTAVTTIPPKWSSLRGFGSTVQVLGGILTVGTASPNPFVLLYNLADYSFIGNVPNVPVPLNSGKIAELHLETLPISNSLLWLYKGNTAGSLQYVVQIPCQDGDQFFQSAGGCVPCPLGQYATSFSSFDTCSLCPISTLNNSTVGAMSSAACTPCNGCSAGAILDSSLANTNSYLCNVPEFEENDATELEGTFYSTSYMTVVIIAIIMVILLASSILLASRHEYSYRYVKKIFKLFEVFEASEEADEWEKIALRILSIVYLCLMFLIIVYFLYILANYQYSISVTTKSFKDFNDAIFIKTLDSPPMSWEVKFYVLTHAGLCSYNIISYNKTGVNTNNVQFTLENFTAFGYPACSVKLRTFNKTGLDVTAVVTFNFQPKNAETFQFFDYRVSTLHDDNFSCERDTTVQATSDIDSACDGTGDSLVGDTVLTINNQVMRGSVVVHLSSIINYIEYCKPKTYHPPFVFTLNEFDCNGCSASGKLLQKFPTTYNLLSGASSLYNSSSLAVSFEITKFQLARYTNIQPLATVGSVFLALVVSAASLKDIIEVILGVLSFFTHLIAFEVKSQLEKRKSSKGTELTTVQEPAHAHSPSDG